MNTEDLHKLIWMSRPLMQAAEACVEQGLEGTALTVRMRAVLEILNRHGALSVPEIAVRLEIQRQYVQLMVNDTLAAGFTEQRPNPRHKRSPLLALTAEGHSLIERIITKELEMLEQLDLGFDAKEIAGALEVVQTVTEKLKEAVRAGR